MHRDFEVAPTDALFHELERLFGHGTFVGSSEGELLERFIPRKKTKRLSEALIARHGRMVLGVCRQMPSRSQRRGRCLSGDVSGSRAKGGHVVPV